MIIVMFIVFAAGLLFGCGMAFRLFFTAATSRSRRALQLLEDTLEGLERSYLIKLATYDAERELTLLSSLHIPPRLDAEDEH